MHFDIFTFLHLGTFDIFAIWYFGISTFGSFGHLATSRLLSVSIETCADKVDFQVDLRLTRGRPEANVLNVLVNTTS